MIHSVGGQYCLDCGKPAFYIGDIPKGVDPATLICQCNGRGWVSPFAFKFNPPNHKWGWMCPKCSNVYSDEIKICLRCNKPTTTRKLKSDEELSTLLAEKVLGYQRSVIAGSGQIVWTKGLHYYQDISFHGRQMYSEAFEKMIIDCKYPTIEVGIDIVKVTARIVDQYRMNTTYIHKTKTIGRAIAIVTLQVYGIEVYDDQEE